jgi:hypothetical protein
VFRLPLPSPDAYFRISTVRVKGLCSHIHISSMGHALVAPPGFECLTLKRRPENAFDLERMQGEL